MTLWGGRFDESPSEVLWAFTTSPVDRRLLVHDIDGSLAHAEMLGRTGILASNDVELLIDGLRRIKVEATEGSFAFLASDEDVHSAVERRLVELIGEVGGKLHTGRSRNDQVALDLRLYLRESAQERVGQIERMIRVLIATADRHAETVVPSYTHLQQAQAVSLGHHLLAYAWMLVRDRERFLAVRSRLAESPLGAGASGGSALPLDPEQVAAILGMEAAFENSMDATGSRDLVAEYGWVCAQTMVHLSRLSEDLILWASQEFAWVEFADEVTTGSSALPQKKNPDIAELARGRTAGAIGHLTSLLTLQKGLPLTYNRDLQEDKEHVFATDDVTGGSLVALAALLEAAEFDPPPPSPWVTALDLAEVLVERGVPFREAHRLVGNLVARLLADGRDLSQATAADLIGIGDVLTPEDLPRTIDVRRSIDVRISRGGGSPSDVRRQIVALRSRLP